MSDSPPVISVIVPVYNEERMVATLVERLRSAPFNKQIIIVDDGSEDKTPEILATIPPDVLVIRHEHNRGKGASIRTALPYVTGAITIIQDADLEYDPNEIPKVVQPIIEGKAQVVYGSRFFKGLPKEMPLPNKIANVILVWAVRLLFFYKLTDEATCYKAFRTELLRSYNLKCERFEFCPEVTAKTLRRGIPIVEVELTNYQPRTKHEGKKIRWTDGIQAVLTLLKYRFRA